MVEQGDQSVLMMKDGEIQRKLPGNDISVIRFPSYAFDLSLFTAERPARRRLAPKDRTLPYLLNPSPNDPIFKKKPQSFRAELHRRFTEWLYPIVFALIALAVIGDARSHREGRINPLMTAVIIALFVRWLGYFAANQVQLTRQAVADRLCDPAGLRRRSRSGSSPPTARWNCRSRWPTGWSRACAGSATA